MVSDGGDDKEGRKVLVSDEAGALLILANALRTPTNCDTICAEQVSTDSQAANRKFE